MKTNIWELIATAAGCGRIRWAPGTWGSLCGVILSALLIELILFNISNMLRLITYGTFLGLIGLISWRSIDKVEQYWPHDDSRIVIDEVAGQALCYLFVLSDSMKPIDYALGFLYFRVFDILKPWPISVIDQQWQSAWGTLLDDLIAGLLAGLCLMMTRLFFPMI